MVKFRMGLDLVLLGSSCLLSSCLSLGRSEKEQLRELESYGISSSDIQVKHPGTAGALNLLPGFGNFYLAIGTDEGEEWLYGFLNLLTWPLSIVWGIPGAAIDAGNINKKETLYYYKFDPQGVAELQRRKAARGSSGG